FSLVGPERDATAAGLEPDEAAHARGDANRAAAVTAVAERDHARRDRRSGTAARAAGTARRVPRVVRRAVRLRLGRGQEAELGCVRLADRDEAGGPELGIEVAVVIGDVAAVTQHSVPEVIGSGGERAIEVF